MNIIENQFFSENLVGVVSGLAQIADDVVVVSGYGKPDVIKSIADNCPNTTVILGMYIKEKKAKAVYMAFEQLAKEGTISLRYCNDRTHAKIYLFKKNGRVFAALVGSANISDSGLTEKDNGEVLQAVDHSNFDEYLCYCNEKFANSIDCAEFNYIEQEESDDNNGKKALGTAVNRFSVEIPLFLEDAEGTRYTPKRSGVNWGNQEGHSKKRGAMESYLKVTADYIDNYPLLFQPKQEVRNTCSGKRTRVNDPIEIRWDDGVIMSAIFSGNGPKREGRLYPNKITSADGGGSELGAYIRSRLGVDSRTVVKYSDLERYGRDTITLTYVQNGVYRADFSKTA